MGKITVVGLGNNARQMTFAAAETLQNASRRILRTARHDAANWLVERELPFSSLDELYEQTDDFDRLNDIAAETVIRAAREEDVVYAVPGAADLTDAHRDALAAFRFQPEPRRGKLPLRRTYGDHLQRHIQRVHTENLLTSD